MKQRAHSDTIEYSGQGRAELILISKTKNGKDVSWTVLDEQSRTE